MTTNPSKALQARALHHVFIDFYGQIEYNFHKKNVLVTDNRKRYTVSENELLPVELTNETIESMIYEIRGQKVMLDFDLARIYGYETRAFNQQVKRNSEKFPEGFMFQLTKAEAATILKSQNVTSSWGGSRKIPTAFSEQGIYMLMTVLRGDLATKQSIALVKAFKRMKDYIVENRPLLEVNEIVKLVQTVGDHSKAISEIKNDLKVIMDNFIDESTYKHFIILNGEKIEADVAYQDIYKKAKSSVIIIDDYIDVKTLQLLKAAKRGVQITIVTDNKAQNNINATFIKDSGLRIQFKHNNNVFHDRFVILDYKTETETFYHCGASSKDAGKRITAINRLSDGSGYYSPIDKALAGPTFHIQ